MRLRDSYDWIVLGDHPGALMSGALAARLGLSVLWVPVKGGEAPELFADPDEEQSFEYYPGHVLGWESGDAGAGILRDCLLRLGLGPKDLETCVGPAEALAALSPSARMRVGGSRQEFREDWVLELGGTEAGADRVYEWIERTSVQWATFIRDYVTLLRVSETDIGPSVSKAGVPRKFLKDRARRRATDGGFTRAYPQFRASWAGAVKRSGVLRHFEALAPRSQEFLLEIPRVVRGQEPVEKDVAWVDVLLAFAWARSARTVSGGGSALRELLLKQLKALGATCATDSEVQRIFSSPQGFQGVQLVGRGQMVAGRGLVVGCSLEAILGAWNGTPADVKALAGAARAPTPAGWRFTVGARLHRHSLGLGTGVARRMAWVERGAPLLELECSSAERERAWVWMRSTVPFEEASLDGTVLKTRAARMLSCVSDQMIPGFRNATASGAGGIRAPLDDNVFRYFGFGSTHLVPVGMRVYSAGAGARLPVEGVFSATSAAFPEVGEFGWVFAALDATTWIAHKKGLPGPLG